MLFIVRTELNMQKFCGQNTDIYVGFEVVTAVVMKSSGFSFITPYSPLKIDRRFGVTCRIYLHGGRISQARNQSEAGRKQNFRMLKQAVHIELLGFKELK
jgi:hypothetical protein